jgi:hypothetical protein
VRACVLEVQIRARGTIPELPPEQRGPTLSLSCRCAYIVVANVKSGSPATYTISAIIVMPIIERCASS